MSDNDCDDEDGACGAPTADPPGRDLIVYSEEADEAEVSDGDETRKAPVT